MRYFSPIKGRKRLTIVRLILLLLVVIIGGAPVVPDSAPIVAESH
jgi:hypothetical protein